MTVVIENATSWNGMEWNGMEWNGMVTCSRLWQGLNPIQGPKSNRTAMFLRVANANKS